MHVPDFSSVSGKIRQKTVESGHNWMQLGSREQPTGRGHLRIHWVDGNVVLGWNVVA